MGVLAVSVDKFPTQFQPNQAFNKQAQIDAIIELAKKTKNWDALENAIDIKIADQTDLVGWWDMSVRAPHVTGSVTSIDVVDAENLTGFGKMQISRMRKRLKNESQYRAQLFGAAYKKAFPDSPLINRNTGDVEWHTPPEYIEMAREVMGSIDTDPASNAIANEAVKAAVYYTINDNGLDKKWLGNVWMNPPYGAREIRQFSEKLVSEIECGNATQAIALTNSATDVGWFNTLARGASLICLTTGRISFHKPDGERTSPTMGQAFFYFGQDDKKFCEVFSGVGLIFEARN